MDRKFSIWYFHILITCLTVSSLLFCMAGYASDGQLEGPETTQATNLPLNYFIYEQTLQINGFDLSSINQANDMNQVVLTSTPLNAQNEMALIFVGQFPQSNAIHNLGLMLNFELRPFADLPSIQEEPVAIELSFFDFNENAMPA